MTRASDWDMRLPWFIAAAGDMVFEWGRLDCCLFAASWVELCTGQDPASDLIGRYRDIKGARRIVKKEGGFEAMVSRRLGVEPHKWTLTAQRGDVASVPGAEAFPALGVVVGAKVAILTPDGLRQEPLQQALAAWRVG